MTIKTLLLTLLMSCSTALFAQKIIWVHQPFSEKELPNWRYSQDTVLFSSDSKIWALVYAPNANDQNAQIALSIKNRQGTEKTAHFDLKKFDPSQLNWHKQIQQRFQFMLKSPHWYYFEITPNPSVVNAYDGVRFLEVLNESAQEKKAAIFTYQRSGDSSAISCSINFKSDGLYRPLWVKLSAYQQIIANKKDVEAQQREIREDCSPPGFEQVVQWGNQKEGLSQELTKSDLDVFLAVENIKILTESIPDAIPSNLKRELRSLFIMDLAILQMPQSPNKVDKIRQKMDLIKQLSLYTELQPILQEYKTITATAGTVKKTEQEQAAEFKDIAKSYAPYAARHQKHIELQKTLEMLDASLLEFD